MAEILILEGDITGIAADALVNAANNHLWMGSGVAGALKRVGGQEIEDEAIAKGPIAVGEAIVTSAGKLKAKYIIHAAVMGQDLQTDAKIIRTATRNSLLRAEELALKSIALPAFGTGVGGFSLEECANIMIQVAQEQAVKTTLEKIIFVPYGQLAYIVFKSELTRQAK